MSEMILHFIDTFKIVSLISIMHDHKDERMVYRKSIGDELKIGILLVADIISMLIISLNRFCSFYCDGSDALNGGDAFSWNYDPPFCASDLNGLMRNRSHRRMMRMRNHVDVLKIFYDVSYASSSSFYASFLVIVQVLPTVWLFRALPSDPGLSFLRGASIWLLLRAASLHHHLLRKYYSRPIHNSDSHWS